MTVTVEWHPNRYGLRYGPGSTQAGDVILSPMYRCGCGSLHYGASAAHGCRCAPPRPGPGPTVEQVEGVVRAAATQLRLI